ncbi:MAG: B12-binding domain-containing radical SAM protein [Elusimicrobia bacterium]|nr:B12-binding domain-containing radical SAM protein [Elusimicrobiota bacterium]
MNVLFIYPNINGSHIDYYSFGLASLVSVTRANGHNARVVIISKEDKYSEVLNEISEFKPRIVGFSSVSSQFDFVKKIAELVKSKFSEIVTVCGGVHPTINPECVLETDFLDGVFVGESEGSFVEFLDKVENGESYKKTDNFAYIEDSRVILNPLKPFIANLDSLPYPDREVYPLDNTIRMAGLVPFLFSRGCPFSCSYCSNHAIAKRYNMDKNRPRYRTPESSICEIEETKRRLPIKSVFIMDDIFGLNKKWRQEFCKKYKKRIGIRFICLLRVDVIDDDFIRLLKDAGCYQISIGIESGNEQIRNNVMNRKMSNEQVMKAVNIIRKYRLRINTINMIGVPGEDERMIWDTIILNRKIKPDSTGVNIFYPYKGTKLGDYCFEKNMVNETLYNSFSNERRETVLNFPEPHKEKMIYYVQNWEALVYPFDIKRALLRWYRGRLRGLLSKIFIWKYLRRLKHFVLFRRNAK